MNADRARLRAICERAQEIGELGVAVLGNEPLDTLANFDALIVSDSPLLYFRWKTAKAHGLDIPTTLLARADDVIE